jgi:error-prone DNA polymerase
MVYGKLQREGEVIHVIVQRCYYFTSLLKHLTSSKKENLYLITLARADETIAPVPSFPGYHKKTIDRNKHS